MKKNVSAFLINNHLYILDYAQNKKAFSNCQTTYQKELCLLFENSGNFFHRPNVKTSLNPLPLFIFVCFLRIPLPTSTLTVIFELPPIIMGNANNLEICPFIISSSGSSITIQYLLSFINSTNCIILYADACCFVTVISTYTITNVINFN